MRNTSWQSFFYIHCYKCSEDMKCCFKSLVHVSCVVGRINWLIDFGWHLYLNTKSIHNTNLCLTCDAPWNSRYESKQDSEKVMFRYYVTLILLMITVTYLIIYITHCLYMLFILCKCSCAVLYLCVKLCIMCFVLVKPGRQRNWPTLCWRSCAVFY